MEGTTGHAVVAFFVVIVLVAVLVILLRPPRSFDFSTDTSVKTVSVTNDTPQTINVDGISSATISPGNSTSLALRMNSPVKITTTPPTSNRYFNPSDTTMLVTPSRVCSNAGTVVCTIVNGSDEMIGVTEYVSSTRKQVPLATVAVGKTTTVKICNHSVIQIVNTTAVLFRRKISRGGEGPYKATVTWSGESLI